MIDRTWIARTLLFTSGCLCFALLCAGLAGLLRAGGDAAGAGFVLGVAWVAGAGGLGGLVTLVFQLALRELTRSGAAPTAREAGARREGAPPTAAATSSPATDVE